MKQFIENNKKPLVDEIEAEVSSQILVNELVKRYPMSHGGIDKTHDIWARTLRDLVLVGVALGSKEAKGRLQ